MSNGNATLDASKALVAATKKLERVEKKAAKSIEKAIAAATKRNETKIAEATAAVAASKAALASTLQ
jgi:hypothetical protein